MKKMYLENIVREFKIEGHLESIDPIGDGHIHHTYHVTTTQAHYILQRINTHIFSSVADLMANIEVVTHHLKSKDVKTLTLVPTLHKDFYFQEYRLYLFIEGKIYLQTPDLHTLTRLGKGIGLFLRALKDCHKEIVDTIPDFHNSLVRLNDFKETLKTYDHKECHDLIAFILDREHILTCITDQLLKGNIPYGLNHNDTKLNNMIMTRTDEILIDLDTVMKGSVLYDYGDALRTCGSTAGEDEKDLSLVSFDLSYFEAFTRGFLSEMTLTQEEMDLLAYAPLALTLENAMRFLKDYLEGDHYYKISYETHNKDRASNQLKLLSSMEDKLDQMKKIIHKIMEEIC